MKVFLVVKGGRREALDAVLRNIFTPVSITLSSYDFRTPNQTPVELNTLGDEWDSEDAIWLEREVYQWDTDPSVSLVDGYGVPDGTLLVSSIVNPPLGLAEALTASELDWGLAESLDYEKLLDDEFAARLDRDLDDITPPSITNTVLDGARELVSAASEFETPFDDEDDLYDEFYEDYLDSERATAIAESDFLITQVEDVIDEHVRSLSLALDNAIAYLMEDVADLIDEHLVR